MCRCGGIPEYEVDGTTDRYCAVCVAEMLRLVFAIFSGELALERERKMRERR